MRLYYPEKVFPAFCFAMAFILARAFDIPGAISWVLIGIFDMKISDPKPGEINVLSPTEARDRRSSTEDPS
jgi:hypothetical protein